MGRVSDDEDPEDVHGYWTVTLEGGPATAGNLAVALRTMMPRTWVARSSSMTGFVGQLVTALERARFTADRPVADVMREAGFGPVPERIQVTYLQDPSAVLRWHYGPTTEDPDPGTTWCDDCGSEVWTLEGGYICRGCGKQDG